MRMSSVRSSPSAPLFAGRAAPRWLPWGVALLVWLCAGFVVAYVALRWLGRSPVTAVPVPSVQAVAVDTQAVARALGAREQRVEPVVLAVAPTRYVLTGVVSPVAGGQRSGVALIAIDGQRPGTYRVGAVVDGRWAVQSVERRTVVLQSADSAGERITLSLPAPES